MHFPGGLLVGCDAGTLNFAKIKGNHTAMKSGMIAAEVIFNALQNDLANTDLTQYTLSLKNHGRIKSCINLVTLALQCIP